MVDRLLALGMFVLGGALMFGAANLEDLELVDPLGHKAFPVIVAVGAVIAGALLLFENFRERSALGDAEEAVPETKSHPVACAGVLGWMLLMFLLLDVLGFIICIAALLFGLMAFFNRNKWAVNSVISVTFSVAFYFVFTEFIGMPLARGILAF